MLGLGLVLPVRLRLVVVVLGVGVVIQLYEHRKMVGPNVGEHLELRQQEVLGVEGVVERVPEKRVPGVERIVEAAPNARIEEAADLLKEPCGVRPRDVV